MAYFYSPSEAAFYHDAVHDADARPSDALPVSDEEHTALFKAQAAGQRIVPGPGGRPIAAEQPPMDPETAMQVLRQRRDALLRDSDRTQIPDYPISEADRAAWATYRQQLRDLPETTTDPATAVWPTPPAE